MNPALEGEKGGGGEGENGRTGEVRKRMDEENRPRRNGGPGDPATRRPKTVMDPVDRSRPHGIRRIRKIRVPPEADQEDQRC
jgi:hypothetical protein